MSEPIFSVLTGKNNFCVSGVSSPTQANGTYVFYDTNPDIGSEIYVNENNYAILCVDDESAWCVGPFDGSDNITAFSFMNFSADQNFLSLNEILNDPIASSGWDSVDGNGDPLGSSGSVSISNC